MPGGVTGLCLLHLGKNRIATQANGSSVNIFMETQGFCPHPKGFRKITRMLTER